MAMDDTHMELNAHCAQTVAQRKRGENRRSVLCQILSKKQNTIDSCRGRSLKVMCSFVLENMEQDCKEFKLRITVGTSQRLDCIG